MVSVMNVFKKKSFWLIVVALISIITILIGFFITQNYINNRKAKEKAQIDAKRKAEIEAMEKETKQALEEYVNNCWFYFDDCDAEEIYINTSQTYDFYTKEENFGYWIQILGDDYFGGKTDSWERFQRNISRRREFYSKTITIPDIISKNTDIQQLNKLIDESNDLCAKLYNLVTNPSSTMTQTEFKNDFDNQTDKVNKVVEEAFSIIKHIREHYIYNK